MDQVSFFVFVALRIVSRPSFILEPALDLEMCVVRRAIVTRKKELSLFAKNIFIVVSRPARWGGRAGEGVVHPVDPLSGG